MKKIIPLFAGLLALYMTVHTQPYYFRHYQVENGLSHSTVFCAVQDKKGFMWFGTKDGLNRFDGYRFKRFNIYKGKKEVLTNDLILSLATDNRGTLWVGTQKGLFYFQAEKETFIPFLDTLHGINDILFDQQGHLWFIADYTVNRYDFRTKKTLTFPSEWFFNATSLCQTGDGTMWFATADGHLQQFNASTQTFKGYNVFGHSPPAESRAIHKIVYDKKGAILVGTSNQGLKEFRLDKLDYQDVLMRNPDQTTIFVRDILPAGNGETWLATESGVFILNRGSGEIRNIKKKPLDPYSLSDNAVYALYKDAEGGIWAGTFFGGLNYFPKQHATFQKFYPDYSKNSISGNAVREICEDNNGNIWIGTEDAGLNKLAPATGLVTHCEPTGKPGSISYYNIHGLLVVKDELWIGTFEHGLNILDINTGKVKKHYVAGAGLHDLKNNFIVSLLQTKKGEIYLGTARGLHQYNRKADNFTYQKQMADGSFISCLLEDGEGTIWIGTHNRGLYFFNPATGEKGHFRNEAGSAMSLPNNSINSLYESSDRSLWVSTEGGGLCRFNRAQKQFTRYTMQNGLPSNFVFKVLEDDKKDLWVTTAKGLVMIDLPENNITVYTKANGLLNDQFNYNSGYRDRKGNFYFGSVQGLIKFDPKGFQSQPVQPVFITGLQVQNKEMEVSQNSGILKKSLLYTGVITLPHNQATFSLDFAALNYTSPETTEYSYIMSGLDNEWTFMKTNRKVYFTDLKPGTYTFRVKAGSNGRWNQPEELTIIITPPLWKTYWAYLLYAVALLLFGYYLVRTYHNIQENKKEKEIYQAKIEFFTNIAHEIKTPLTLIKGPVENLSELAEQVPDIEEEVSTLNRNTDRLLNLINQILDFRQTETKGFSLDFAEVNISEVLRESYLTFKPLAKKRSLSYTLNLPSFNVTTLADAEALRKVFDNLFSNAVKYGKQEVSAILLPPGSPGNKLMIEISNDGYVIPDEMKDKIFEPFFRLKDTKNLKGTGLGLALARSLVELHNGTIYVKRNTTDRNIFLVELPYQTLQSKRKSPLEQTSHLSD